MENVGSGYASTVGNPGGPGSPKNGDLKASGSGSRPSVDTPRGENVRGSQDKAGASSASGSRSSVDSPRGEDVDNGQRSQVMLVEPSKETPDASLPSSSVPLARTARRPHSSGNQPTRLLLPLLYIVGAIIGQAVASEDQAVDCKAPNDLRSFVGYPGTVDLDHYLGLPENLNELLALIQSISEDKWNYTEGRGSMYTAQLSDEECEGIPKSISSQELQNHDTWVHLSPSHPDYSKAQIFSENIAFLFCLVLEECGYKFEIGKVTTTSQKVINSNEPTPDPNNKENIDSKIYLAGMLSLLGVAGVVHNGYLSHTAKNRLDLHLSKFVTDLHSILVDFSVLGTQAKVFGEDQTHQRRFLAYHLALTVAFGVMRYFDSRDEDGHVEVQLDPSTKNIAIIGGLPLIAHLFKEFSSFLNNNHNGNLLGKPNTAQLDKILERLGRKIQRGQDILTNPLQRNKDAIEDQITQTIKDLKQEINLKTFIDNPGRCEKLLSSVGTMVPELFSLVSAWAVSTTSENNSLSVFLAALGYIVSNISIQKMGSKYPFYGSVDSQAAIKALKKLEGVLSNALKAQTAAPRDGDDGSGAASSTDPAPAPPETGATDNGLRSVFGYGFRFLADLVDPQKPQGSAASPTNPLPIMVGQPSDQV